MQRSKTQNKQIQLLREYIQALERQVATNQREIIEMGKFQNLSENDLQRLQFELEQRRSENQRLKIDNVKWKDAVKKHATIQVQFSVMLQALQRQKAEKDGLLIRIQKIAQDNQTLFEYNKHISNQINQKTVLLENQVKKNEDSYKAISEFKIHFEQLQKEKNKLKFIISLKQAQINSAKEKYQAFFLSDTKQIEVSYVQRQNFKKILKDGQEKRKQLEQANKDLLKKLTFIHEAQSSLQILTEDIQLRLKHRERQIFELNHQKEKLKMLILDMKRELEIHQTFSGELSQEKSRLDSEYVKLRKHFQEQIKQKIQQIQYMSDKQQKMRNQLKSQTNIIVRLQEELKQVKNQHICFQNQIDFLKNSLKESQSTVQRQLKQKQSQKVQYQENIKSLSNKINQLEVNISSSNRDTDQTHQRPSETIAKLNCEFGERIQFYDVELAEGNKKLGIYSEEINILQRKLAQSQETIRSFEVRGNQSQWSLNLKIKQLQFNQNLQLQQLDRLKSQHKSLSLILTEKQKEIDSLQNSNQTLRKLIISSKVHEQATMKELQSIKHTICTNSTTSLWSYNSSVSVDIPQKTLSPKAYLRIKKGLLKSGQIPADEMRNNSKSRTPINYSRILMVEDFELDEQIEYYQKMPNDMDFSCL